MDTKDKANIKKYNMFIILSILDVIVIVVAIMVLLNHQILKSQTLAFNSGPDYWYYIKVGAFVLHLIVAIICYPILNKQRLKYRELAEFNDDGTLRRQNDFSKLSNAEQNKINLQNIADRERILSSGTLASIKRNVSSDPDAELNELIGLIDVKKEVTKMKARMEYELSKVKKAKHKKEKETVRLNSTGHMVFLGKAGTGKTTVARIVASYLYKYHYIEKPYYFEIDGNFFNGLSIGEASKKVTYLCAAAKGSCIYIDEAYALTSIGTQEVIASLVKQMEDNSNDIVFIFSGYKKEMNTFLNSNSGIKSRIKYWFEFNDYTNYELGEIFIKMANKNNLVPNFDLVNEVSAKIGATRNNPNFGNARDVRNELDKIIDNHAYNLMQKNIEDKDRYTLTLNDLRLK